MRVIEPQEVFDALNIAVAELQRIKYRLGLERIIEIPDGEGEKTPDEVIQILEWAIGIMPDFSRKPLVQYDHVYLRKTPDHVFAVSAHTINELKRYRNFRGIKNPVRSTPVQSGIQPMHVYQKTLDNLNKISRLRVQLGLGEIVVPEYPLRKITPTEVFDLAVRIDLEMGIIYGCSGMDNVAIGLDIDLDEYDNKTPSDVFTNMWHFSFMLDTIIGSEGYTPSDVYQQALRVSEEIKIIARYLEIDISLNLGPKGKNKKPSDVIVIAREVRDLFDQAKKHAGIFDKRIITERYSSEGRQILPDDVFNELGLILAEIIELKLHLGITEIPGNMPIESGRIPSDVYRQLEVSRYIINEMLNI